LLPYVSAEFIDAPVAICADAVSGSERDRRPKYFIGEVGRYGAYADEHLEITILRMTIASREMTK
jgi:hypothetical protein